MGLGHLLLIDFIVSRSNVGRSLGHFPKTGLYTCAIMCMRRGMRKGSASRFLRTADSGGAQESEAGDPRQSPWGLCGMHASFFMPCSIDVHAAWHAARVRMERARSRSPPLGSRFSHLGSRFPPPPQGQSRPPRRLLRARCSDLRSVARRGEAPRTARRAPLRSPAVACSQLSHGAISRCGDAPPDPAEAAALIAAQADAVRALKDSGKGNKDPDVIAAVAELLRLKALLPDDAA